MTYLAGYGTRTTPQNEPIPGSSQVENSAGGYTWQVDKWDRLKRFLILGAEGGSYYASERKMTVENASCIRGCLAEDAQRTVDEIVAISTAARAPKNDPAIFALAMASAGPHSKYALEAIPLVCRTGTHLFLYAKLVQDFRGWGRGLARGVSAWYEREDVGQLAYQAIKYRQRGGWTHRDLLRLAHPSAPTPDHAALYDWMCGRENDDAPAICRALDKLAAKPTAKRAIRYIDKYDLPREAIPSDLLNDPDVWESLLERMPMTAMIRNLATMTRIGLLTPMGDHVRTITERLADTERLRKARIHPIAVLSTLTTYAKGHGARGQHTWTPVPQITDALDSAFYTSFGNVEPTGKRTMLALDVSGSMDWSEIAGVPGLTPRVASAAMALVTANVERENMGIAAFSTDFVWANISPRQRLDEAIKVLSAIPMGGTDCALPMLAATQNKIAVDTFVVYTDSETWAGRVHPSQALSEYREKSGIDARLVVVGMVSNGFTIADPADQGMLDVVGFDSATPQVISGFSAGEF